MVTKKLSEEFSRTKSRILGALSKLDEFLLNPQVRTCSVAVPGASRNNNSENRETTGDHSLEDSCSEVMFCASHTSNQHNSEQEKAQQMMAGVQEEIAYCSPGTSSGNQKKAHSTIHSQFCNENTPAAIEAGQTLLAFQQLASNSISAIFNNNVSRISKLPKSLTMT